MEELAGETDGKEVRLMTKAGMDIIIIIYCIL